jgi:hypothetical protein
VRYKVVEVPPSKPAQPVIEGTLAKEGTEEEGEAEVEPKPEPVEPVLPPVIVPWTDETLKELKITMHKNDAGKEVIESLDLDDEMLAEEKGKEKEPDTKDGDENAPDSQIDTITIFFL